MMNPMILNILSEDLNTPELRNPLKPDFFLRRKEERNAPLFLADQWRTRV